ncbi:MAG: hypothetical protein CMM47_07110 [Rhodospirillaceae bacterium]|nr:hypothetical protein [Rhodospirillaceae bacterium]|tara:strand:- start:465 stop:1244 length:780 start_codon:yes stop_codon:yes gene_type:complete
MKWYFCANEEGVFRYESSIKVAVESAVQRTSLDPHVIYDGGHHPILDWMQSRGVTIVKRRTPLAPDILARPNGPGFRHRIALAVYLRYEVPLVEPNDQFCLYSDSDVMFVTDPDVEAISPSILAAAPEFVPQDWSYFNSGVMMMNLDAMRQDYDNLIARSREMLKGSAPYDQPALNDFYRNRWDRLPLDWNWKPYWGHNPDAKIVHFHGPKFQVIQYLLGEGEETLVHEIWRDLFGRAPEAYRHYLAEARALVPDLNTD